MSEIHVLEVLAAAAHMANRAYCLGLNPNDLSQEQWQNAPEWQKSSAIEGVKTVLAGEGRPEQLHAKWREKKLADGWKYGPVKDPAKKEHPCIVDNYADLPADQRLKDVIFYETVSSLAKVLNLLPH